MVLAFQPRPLRQAIQAFNEGQSEKAFNLLHELEPSDCRRQVVASRIALFASKFSDAEQLTNEALWQLPFCSQYYREAFYIKQEALRKQKKYRQARDLLSYIPFTDRSNNYYKNLRLAVDSIDTISFYEKHTQQLPIYGAEWRRASENYLLLLRDLGQTEKAINIAQIRFQKIRKYFKFGQFRTVIKVSSTNRYWTQKASRALADLQDCLNNRGVEFFLISGTLLGLIREGKILSHDKDIDIGIDERFSMKVIENAIDSAPQFKLREIYNQQTVYVEHANGAHIDIFRHRIAGNSYIHSGMFADWVNTPFSLVKASFLDREFKIPSNYELYLSENYGNWKKPIKNFETFFDTINIIISNKSKFKLYKYIAAAKYYLNGDKYKFNRVFGSIESL